MDFLWTALLGAIQGATEFLPVSSSGHLAAGRLLLERGGLTDSLSDQPLLLEILLHLATLVAVLIVYRKEALAALAGGGRAFVALFRGRLPSLIEKDDNANLALAIVLGTIPTGILGVSIKDVAAGVSDSPRALGLCFLGCACLLAASKWWKGGTRRLTPGLAFLIGVAQGLAVLPGISRSGMTIAFALALGLDRDEAARFSFLLSVPAILGAAVLELDLSSLAAGDKPGVFSAGAAAALLVGLAALVLLIRLVRAGRLWMFAPYVAAVGIATLVLL